MGRRRGDPSCAHRMEGSSRWRWTSGLRASRLILSAILVPFLGSVLLCHASLEAAQELGSSGTEPSGRFGRELTSGVLRNQGGNRVEDATESSSLQSSWPGLAHSDFRLLQRESILERQAAAPHFRRAGERVFSLASASTESSILGTRRGMRELLQQRRPFGIQVVSSSRVTQVSGVHIELSSSNHTPPSCRSTSGLVKRLQIPYLAIPAGLLGWAGPRQGGPRARCPNRARTRPTSDQVRSPSRPAMCLAQEARQEGDRMAALMENTQCAQCVSEILSHVCVLLCSYMARLLALRSTLANRLLLTPPCAAPVTLSSGAQGCSELAPFCDVSPAHDTYQ